MYGPFLKSLLLITGMALLCSASARAAVIDIDFDLDLNTANRGQSVDGLSFFSTGRTGPSSAHAGAVGAFPSPIEINVGDTVDLTITFGGQALQTNQLSWVMPWLSLAYDGTNRGFFTIIDHTFELLDVVGDVSYWIGDDAETDGFDFIYLGPTNNGPFFTNNGAFSFSGVRTTFRVLSLTMGNQFSGIWLQAQSNGPFTIVDPPIQNPDPDQGTGQTTDPRRIIGPHNTPPNATVPAPGTLVLFLLGLTGLGILRRK